MASPYLILAVALALNACANVLLKYGMRDSLGGLGPVGMIKEMVTSVPIVAGVALFGLNVVFYAQALRKIPLSIAYPVMTSLGLAIVTAASILLLGEKVRVMQFVGFALIIAGVVCVTR